MAWQTSIDGLLVIKINYFECRDVPWKTFPDLVAFMSFCEQLLVQTLIFHME